MKNLVLAAVFSLTGLPAQQAVLLELFTSEGCSSCPPADQLLETLHRTQPVASAQLIVLSEHVDYWNHIGWKDPYSSAAFSRRQQAYARRFGLPSVYTPQLVVHGRSEVVGNDAPAVQQAIAKSLKEQTIQVRMLSAEKQPTVMLIEVDALPTALGVRDAVVMLATVDSQIAVSKVSRGENSGRELRHVAVVRDLREIGVVTKDQPFTHSVPVAPDSRLVAFVQERRQGRVLGAATR